MKPRRRFSEARDLAELARMLDEVFQAGSGAAGAAAPIRIEARAEGPVLAGQLVQALPGARVRQASAASERPAGGVALGRTADGRIEWAPLALVALALEGTAAAGSGGELWLGRRGTASLSKPESGFIQQIGTVIEYDAKLKKHWCLVHPQPGITVY